jgi:hypothetical protein
MHNHQTPGPYWSMAKKNRTPLPKLSKSPGPSEYDIANTVRITKFVSPNYSMGTERRMKYKSINHTLPMTPLRTSKTNGFSKLANKTEFLSKKFGKMGRGGRRRETNNDTGPGPAGYSPTKPPRGKGGEIFGAKIGSSVRKGMHNSSSFPNPGSGHYYPRFQVCEKEKNNWNFGYNDQRPAS